MLDATDVDWEDEPPVLLPSDEAPLLPAVVAEAETPIDDDTFVEETLAEDDPTALLPRVVEAAVDVDPDPPDDPPPPLLLVAVELVEPLPEHAETITKPRTATPLCKRIVVIVRSKNG